MAINKRFVFFNLNRLIGVIIFSFLMKNSSFFSFIFLMTVLLSIAIRLKENKL